MTVIFRGRGVSGTGEEGAREYRVASERCYGKGNYHELLGEGRVQELRAEGLMLQRVM